MSTRLTLRRPIDLRMYVSSIARLRPGLITLWLLLGGVVVVGEAEDLLALCLVLYR